MNIDNIVVFLKVAEEQSLSKAAELLFLTQPTVSNRLAALENELGLQLIFRHKGQRSIELTPAGYSFLPLAQQWAALYQDTDKLKRQKFRKELRIGCPDTLSDGFLLPFFRDLQNKEGIHLNLTTYYSQDIVNAVAERKVDISLGFYQRTAPNVVSVPMFHEKMKFVLSCPSSELGLQKSVSPDQLMREDEIYTNWSPEFQQWHDSWWNRDEKPFASVETILQMKELMQGLRCWALIPYYLERYFTGEKGFLVKPISGDSPERICYLFHHKYPDVHTEKSLYDFRSRLTEYCAGLNSEK